MACAAPPGRVGCAGTPCRTFGRWGPGARPPYRSARMNRISEARVLMSGALSGLPGATAAPPPTASPTRSMGRCARRSTTGDRRRGRHGDRSRGRVLPRRVRGGGCRDRAPDDSRCLVPHRLDDQADHLGRRPAARRGRPPAPRRSGRAPSAGVRRRPGARVLRSAPPATIVVRPATQCGHGAPSHDPLLGARLRLHQPGGARFQAARRARSFRSGRCMFEPGERWLYGTSTDWLGRADRSGVGRAAR